MHYFLGVDIGGTSIKVAYINNRGKILNKEKFATQDLRKNQDFVANFHKIIDAKLRQFPKISKVGIAIPGIQNKKGNKMIFVPNIPELNQVKFTKKLQKSFPKIRFFVENDANAALLGEYYFSTNQTTRSKGDLIFITLGTGIGGAALIDGKLFRGGKGNALETGFVLAQKGASIEKNIGKKGLIDYLKKKPDINQFLSKGKIDIKKAIKLAEKGNKSAKQLFKMMGEVLADALIANICILDIHTIVIGGGIAKSFEWIKPSLKTKLENNLPQYYQNKLNISLATLGNNAGVIGAASLCF